MKFLRKIIYDMSYKITALCSYTFCPEGSSDIIGPSHKKIKDVRDRLSIYGFGLTTYLMGIPIIYKQQVQRQHL